MSASVDENLLPAIGQVFVIIGLGYVCGRLNILRAEDSKSLSWFAGNIALPAALFESMANIHFETINWTFMAGIVLSKVLVFLLVAVVTFLVKRPRHPGYAGLYAIFSIDANDLALGLPLMTALYSETVDGQLRHKFGPGRFDYIDYMFLVAPIALLLLNPIGFVLIELGNRLEEYKDHPTKDSKFVIFGRIMLQTIKGVIKSPVVFMTVLGVIVNMIIFYGVKKGVRESDSDENLPLWLSPFLNLLGAAFAPLALFRLGNILVGKLKLLTGTVLIVDLLLIVAKSLLLAFLILLFLSLFGLPEELVSFGFLYGTFPTTPSVFVYATTYKIGVDVISTSMVLGTFISAPLMYATARVTLIEAVNITDYHEVIYYTELDVSSLSLAGAMLVILIFLVAKRYKSLVYVIILHLMTAQLPIRGIRYALPSTAQVLTNVGAIGTFAVTNNEAWKLFFFTIYEGSYLAMKMWSATLCFSYFVKLRWGDRVAEWFWIPLLGASWILPFAGTITLVVICAIMGASVHENVNDTQLLGDPQLILDAIFVFPCLLLSMVFMLCSVLQFTKRTAGRKQGAELRQLETSTSHKSQTSAFETSTIVSLAGSGNDYGAMDDVPMINARDDDINDVTANSVDDGDTDVEDAEDSMNTTADVSHDNMSSSGSADDVDPRVHLRITILMMTLSASILWSAVWLIWTFAVASAITGTFMLVTILSIVIIHGQGFMFLAIFGLEKHWFWIVLLKKIRKVIYAIEFVELPAPDDLEPEMLKICTEFKVLYQEQCTHDIVSTKKYHLKKYENVFVGRDLVKWLIREKVVPSAEDGISYGHALLCGRVLAHVQKEHYFHSNAFFYEFL